MRADSGHAQHENEAAMRLRWAGWRELHVNRLLAQQLHASSAMLPPAPILPENGLWANDERMQQHAHLARFRGDAAHPLTLFTQRAGATTADAGCIDHTQASIDFSASDARRPTFG